MLAETQDFIRTAAQNKAENGSGIDSISEIVAICEKEGFIPRYYTDQPQDAVDRTLQDLQQYTKKLVTEETNLGNMIESSLKQIIKDKERESVIDVEDEVDDDIEELFDYDKKENLTYDDYEDFFDSQNEEEDKNK